MPIKRRRYLEIGKKILKKEKKKNGGDWPGIGNEWTAKGAKQKKEGKEPNKNKKQRLKKKKKKQ